jgi:plasmid replication initiation protein
MSVERAFELLPAEQELAHLEVGGAGQKIVRAEVNLLNLPFFVLSGREMHTQRETVYEVEERVGDTLVQRIWRVTGSQHLGHPAPFDKKVFRAIEAIIDEQGYPVENPVTFTTYELLKKMGERIGGRQYQMVRKSIDRIVATTIIAQNIFWRKSRRSWHSETFHIYERCIHQGEELPGGRIAEKNHLWLHPLYLESLNARYVKPIDYEYYKSLERPVAKRLYELLGYKFYGAMKNGSDTLVYNYQTLCKLLPLKPQKYPSLAKRCMSGAHEELIRTGFLAHAVWRGWKIYYQAGPKALEEFQCLARKAEEALEPLGV